MTHAMLIHVYPDVVGIHMLLVALFLLIPFTSNGRIKYRHTTSTGCSARMTIHGYHNTLVSAIPDLFLNCVALIREPSKSNAFHFLDSLIDFAMPILHQSLH